MARLISWGRVAALACLVACAPRGYAEDPNSCPGIPAAAIEMGFSPAVLRSSSEVQYPRELACKGIGGAVAVCIRVSSRGRVSDVVVLDGTTAVPQLVGEVVRQVRKRRYDSAILGDRPVASWVPFLAIFTAGPEAVVTVERGGV